MSMRNRIKKSVAAADNKLAEREARLLLTTNLDLAKLSPAIQGHDKYQELVSLIKAASARNLSVADLENNIRQLGDEAWELAKDIIEAVR